MYAGLIPFGNGRSPLGGMVGNTAAGGAVVSGNTAWKGEEELICWVITDG